MGEDGDVGLVRLGSRKPARRAGRLGGDSVTPEKETDMALLVEVLE